MTAGRALLAGLIALLLAVGASSTASAGAGLRIELIHTSTGLDIYHVSRGSSLVVAPDVGSSIFAVRVNTL